MFHVGFPLGYVAELLNSLITILSQYTNYPISRPIVMPLLTFTSADDYFPGNIIVAK